jgi:hypothetical protein
MMPIYKSSYNLLALNLPDSHFLERTSHHIFSPFERGIHEKDIGIRFDDSACFQRCFRNRSG